MCIRDRYIIAQKIFDEKLSVRDTEDVVETIGVDRARTYASKADLVILSLIHI